MRRGANRFPGSEPFWQFLADLFKPSWAFQSRDPILPPRSLWDGWQLLKALRPDTLSTIPYTFSTVGDALRGFGLESDRRLRTFLDLQLKLYPQVNAQIVGDRFEIGMIPNYYGNGGL